MERPGLLAIAAGLLLACADTNAPPPEPLELLLVVNRLGNSLTIVPVEDAESRANVSLGAPSGGPRAVAARERFALVPLSGVDAVAVVDLLGRRLVHRIPLPTGSGATGVAVVDDSVAYVANPNLNTVSRVNYLSRDTAEVPVGVYPQGITFTRGRLFVLNGNLDETGEPVGASWITVLDPATNRPASGIDSIPLTGSGNAAFAAVAGDGLLYVVNRGGTLEPEGRLSIVDPLERAEIASFSGLGALPGGLATDGDSRVFVSSTAEGLLEFDIESNDLVRGEGEGVSIPSNSGVAVDSRRRIYAIESGACGPGQAGVAHVLDEDLEEVAAIPLGRCSAGAAVVRIGFELTDTL
jgi:hypothetical protein